MDQRPTSLRANREVTKAGVEAQRLDEELRTASTEPAIQDHERLIRRERGLQPQMRIMMVTTETEMDYVQQALTAGADEYVMKPFTKDVILEKLGLLGITAG